MDKNLNQDLSVFLNEKVQEALQKYRADSIERSNKIQIGFSFLEEKSQILIIT
ncbi:hypothetical protein KC726_00925 [Candidatus Woesebacteria bacterium]|nr:hypothetical protein [Candidatus Woesebacteria bacterium]